MKIYLLRHGKTAGNLKGRYIGRTDEPLCREGEAQLCQKRLVRPDALYVSPMLRCRQSAAILFPGMEQRIVEDFRECDFGEFENQNSRELSENPAYQKWVDSGGTLPFPKGESREGFQERCVRAFEDVLHRAAREKSGCIACVVHGGTIMSILAAADTKKRNYFDYQTENGHGYLITWDESSDTAVRCEIEGEV